MLLLFLYLIVCYIYFIFFSTLKIEFFIFIILLHFILSFILYLYLRITNSYNYSIIIMRNFFLRTLKILIFLVFVFFLSNITNYLLIEGFSSLSYSLLLLLLVLLFFLNNFDSQKNPLEFYLVQWVYIYSAFSLLFFTDFITFLVSYELQNVCIYSILGLSTWKICGYTLRYFFISFLLSQILFIMSILNINYFFIYNLYMFDFQYLIFMVILFKFGIFPFIFWLV